MRTRDSKKTRQIELQRQTNYTTHAEDDLILVVVEDSLVHTKSGGQYPKNIADFMPDYNLWYALKFCNPGNVWVVENKDLTSYGWNFMRLDFHETRYSFITKWLSQMIENPECHRLYSIRGNWVYGWGYSGDEEIPDLIQRWNKEARKILFIDRDTRESESYIKSKKGFDF